VIEARTLRVWRLGAIGVAGALALIWGVTRLPGLGAPGGGLSGLGILVHLAAMVLALAWACVFAVLAFRQSDEFSRTGATFSWHWGALLGLVLSVPVVVFVQEGGLHWIDPSIRLDRGAGRIFGYGYLLAVSSQLVGYFAVLAWWKASKR
jgi:hypothetical protein